MSTPIVVPADVAVWKTNDPEPPLPVPFEASKVILPPLVSVPLATPPRTVTFPGEPSEPRTIALFVVSTVNRPLPVEFWTWKAVVELAVICDDPLTFKADPEIGEADIIAPKVEESSGVPKFCVATGA